MAQRGNSEREALEHRTTRDGGIGRRGFLRLTGAAGAAGALGASPLLAACGPSTPGGGTGPVAGKGVRIKEYVPGPQPASGGRYGGTVSVAWSDPPDSFDPALGESLTAWDCITQLIYFGGLMAYDKQFAGPVPNLAAGPPDISSDGTTLTFTIRPDVKFHNGRTIVAQDFKYSWERLLDPKLASWGSSYLASIAGASEVLAGKTRQLDGVQVQGDRTLIVHLTAPDFTILNAFALPISAPVPQEAVEQLGSKFGQTPVGYGPFKITSYDSAAQTARFERNPDYFYPGLPYLDAVEYRWGIDPQIQMLQLQNGTTDILGPGIPSSQAGRVLATPTLRPLAKSFPSPGNFWLTMYPTSAPEFGSQTVRQALNWAIDRPALGRILYQTATPWGAPFPANIADFTRTFQPYGYDPRRAKQMLAQAGYKNGFSVTLTVASADPFPAIAQVVQQQLAAVGVRVTLNQVSSNAEYSLEAGQQAGGKKVQLTADSWYMVQPTPADEVDAMYVTKASSNYCGYSNPQVDKLAAQAKRTFDTGARNKLYAQIQQIVGEDAPFIFLASTDWLAGVSKRIQNYKYRGETYSYYDRMWV
jgi:ABC-type transport system substrate-binding protein